MHPWEVSLQSRTARAFAGNLRDEAKLQAAVISKNAVRGSRNSNVGVRIDEIRRAQASSLLSAIASSNGQSRMP